MIALIYIVVPSVLPQMSITSVHDHDKSTCFTARIKLGGIPGFFNLVLKPF